MKNLGLSQPLSRGLVRYNRPPALCPVVHCEFPDKSIMQFFFRTLDVSGFIQQGVLYADSEAEVLAQLKERGLTPLELKTLESSVQQQSSKGAQSVRHADIVALVRELATLLESGVGLSEAFSTLLEATTHSGLRDALSQLNAGVRGGEGFSFAIQKSNLNLPQYVYALSRAGEATGDLGSALARCADQLEFDERMRAEAKEALTYPVILVFTGVAAIAFIFSFVVPRFAGMLQGRSVDLPLLSRWVLSTGVYLHDHWVGVALSLFAVMFVGYTLSRHGKAGAAVLKSLSRIPLMSNWVAGGETARWTSMLSVLVQSKVPILLCIELAAASVQLPENASRLKSVEDDVRRGKRFSSAIEDRRLLEGSSLTMLKVGEKSGQLGAMLGYVARHSADKHRALQRRVVALIEPISILVIGLALGIIMVGVVMAMTSLTEINL